MFDSPTAAPETLRGPMADLLNGLVVDGLALSMAVHVAHWNLKGRAFGPLHTLFDELYDALNDHVDRIAERVVTLGGVAVGTVGDVAALTTITPYPKGMIDGFDHVREIAARLKAYAASIQAVVVRLDDAQFMADVNVLSDVLESLEKFGWKLLAHLA